MKMIIARVDKYDNNYFGNLYIGDTYFCDTLENTEYLIPCGEYNLTLSYSNKFKKILPEIKGVKNRTGIRIHAGNYAKDSQGCILVGERNKDMLIHSRKTLEKLINSIKDLNINSIEIKEIV